MIKRRNRARDESTIDITPMLDIVFIMLIFFIVKRNNQKTQETKSGPEIRQPVNKGKRKN
jgi:biopolymer transport protein ExbD